MNRTVIRRRRVGPRIDVEALESRYVLDASLSTVVLVSNFGPGQIGDARDTFVAPIQFESVESGARAPAHAPPPPVLAAPVESRIEIDVFRLEVRDPFGGVQFVETFAFQSFTEISNRPPEPSLEEAVSFASANQGRPLSGSNAPGSNGTTSEQSATNAARSEEAAASVNSNLSEAAVAGASIAARRTSPFAAAAPPADRRVDRPVPTAFATSLAADAVRPTDANVHDLGRPTVTTGDLSTPRVSMPIADPQGAAESTSQSMPVEQARDAVFGGLFVDGFAPRLLDQAFRALKSVESNLETPDGSRWYRLALSCWMVAAALAYEAGRQSQNSTARALRYASASLREPDPEDDR